MSKRPLRTADAVIEFAAEKMEPQVTAWLQGEGDRQSTLADLKRALRGSFGFDGYEIARRLDDYSWSPDSDLVEILNGAFSAIEEGHTKVVMEWVKAEGVVVALAVGDRAKCRYGVGQIVEVREATASYVLAPDGDPRFAKGGGYIIAAEDCESVPEGVA